MPPSAYCEARWWAGRISTATARSAAQTTAILYSLIETAKLRGVDPAKYLREAVIAAIRRPGTVTLPS